MTQSVVTAIVGVFDAVFDWIVTAIQSVIPIFWASEGGLTFLGVLCLVSLSIAIFFLLVGLIQNFLHLRS